MPQSFASLLVHVVFSTKNRARELSPQLAARLFPYMAGIVKERKGVPLIVNGPADHHRRVSFQEEFLTFLRKHGLAYEDGRDLWG